MVASEKLIFHTNPTSIASSLPCFSCPSYCLPSIIVSPLFFLELLTVLTGVSQVITHHLQSHTIVLITFPSHHITNPSYIFADVLYLYLYASITIYRTHHLHFISVNASSVGWSTSFYCDHLIVLWLWLWLWLWFITCVFQPLFHRDSTALNSLCQYKIHILRFNYSLLRHYLCSATSKSLM